MTTSAPALPGAVARAQVGRARALLVAGVIGAHVAGLTCIGIFTVIGGARGMASAAVGFALVLLFSTIGQLIMTWLAAARPQVVMLAAVASYLGRCAMLTVALGWVFSQPELLAVTDRLALVVTTAVTVIGWITAEIVRFTRMRIPAFEVDLPGEQGPAPVAQGARA